MWSELIMFVAGAVFGYLLKLAYEVIDRRYEKSLKSKVPPGDEYACDCGNRHLLVKEFGKCGSCWEQLHKTDCFS